MDMVRRKREHGMSLKGTERGGARNNNADNARSAYRNDNTPDNANSNVGFRCVVVPHSLPGPECRTSTESRRVHDGRARGPFPAGATQPKRGIALPPAVSR